MLVGGGGRDQRVKRAELADVRVAPRLHARPEPRVPVAAEFHVQQVREQPEPPLLGFKVDSHREAQVGIQQIDHVTGALVGGERPVPHRHVALHANQPQREAEPEPPVVGIVCGVSQETRKLRRLGQLRSHRLPSRGGLTMCGRRHRQ